MSAPVRAALRNYTRWVTGDAAVLHADILGGPVDIAADPSAGTVQLNGAVLTPDEARMVGVRLIDAAVLADGPRAIRATPRQEPGTRGPLMRRPSMNTSTATPTQAAGTALLALALAWQHRSSCC